METIFYVTPKDDLQSVLDQAPAGAVIHLSEGIFRQKIAVFLAERFKDGKKLLRPLQSNQEEALYRKFTILSMFQWQ